MRIALVAHHGSPLTQAASPDSFPPVAGVAAHARVLAKLGHRVTIYARRDSRGLPGSAILAPRVTIEHVAAGPPAPLAPGELSGHVGAFGDYLAQRWHRNPPSVAHAYFWTSGLAALAAVRDLDVPLVQTFGTLGVAQRWLRPRHPAQGRHGSQDYGQNGRIRLEACIARGARAVLASTAAEAAELGRMGVPRAAVTVVPYGVDTAEFTPEGRVAKRTGRPRLLAVAQWGGVAGSEPAWGGVAGSELAEPEHEGLDVLVRVLARVPGAELVIAGGPARAQLSKDRIYQDLTHLARRFGVADRLVFTGRVAPGDLPALLRSADLLVGAAPSDPSGAVAIASMACGTPVAACSAGGLRDAVLDGTTGVLVPPGRPDLLGRRVRLLLASPLRLEAFGIAAADRARARYSWDRVSREALAVYERCLRPVATGLVQATS